jgi:hypothetical protein
MDLISGFQIEESNSKYSYQLHTWNLIKKNKTSAGIAELYERIMVLFKLANLLILRIL